MRPVTLAEVKVLALLHAAEGCIKFSDAIGYVGSGTSRAAAMRLAMKGLVTLGDRTICLSDRPEAREAAKCASRVMEILGAPPPRLAGATASAAPGR